MDKNMTKFLFWKKHSLKKQILLSVKYIFSVNYKQNEVGFILSFILSLFYHILAISS